MGKVLCGIGAALATCVALTVVVSLALGIVVAMQLINHVTDGWFGLTVMLAAVLVVGRLFWIDLYLGCRRFWSRRAGPALALALLFLGGCSAAVEEDRPVYSVVPIRGAEVESLRACIDHCADSDLATVEFIVGALCECELQP